MKIGRGVSELWGVENRPLPLTWPMAYTTACTTVQAVILWQASIASLTYFFYDVILHCRPLTHEMAYLLHICGGFFLGI